MLCGCSWRRRVGGVFDRHSFSLLRSSINLCPQPLFSPRSLYSLGNKVTLNLESHWASSEQVTCHLCCNFLLIYYVLLKLLVFSYLLFVFQKLVKISCWPMTNSFQAEFSLLLYRLKYLYIVFYFNLQELGEVKIEYFQLVLLIEF